MRILFITTLEHVKWGGSEALWSQCALKLNEMDYQVMCCIKEWQHPPIQITKLVEQNITPYYRKKKRYLFKLYENYLKIDHEKKILKLSKPDYVIISLSSHWTGVKWALACRNLNIPYSQIFQIVNEMKNFEDGKPQQNFKASILNADRNYFVSIDNNNVIAKLIASDIPNSDIVWNPFNVNIDTPYHPLSTDLPAAFACVASLTPSHKGQDILFEVLAQDKWKNRDLTVRLYGEGAYREYLQDLKQYYDLKKVSFEGYSNNIDELWENNHALILPSRKEGMSLAMIEAMIKGRFCIATKVGGAEEIITDNVNGFLAKAPTVELVDEAMERAWNARSQWPKISENAYHSIRQQIPSDPAAFLTEKLIARFNAIQS